MLGRPRNIFSGQFRQKDITELYSSEVDSYRKIELNQQIMDRLRQLTFANVNIGLVFFEYGDEVAISNFNITRSLELDDRSYLTVTTNGITIQSRGIDNGDGWDPDSSKNMMIFDTKFDTGDDCIAIKSGKNPDGNRVNIPTENIRIFELKMLGGNGMAIGSEESVYYGSKMVCGRTF